MGLFGGRKTVFVDADILVIGGGMAGCGATYESRYWGRDLKIVCVEKANIERSGAVAQGLYAINCYMGMQWGENQPEDHVRYARNDLMGLVREDLGYDIARHVDGTVHKFEEWGLPMMKDPKTGRYQREGKWQIMIHGESYKPIVAEAARKAATEVYNRIMVTHLLMDKSKANRVAGAVGFNVRTGDYHVFRAKAVIVCAGGASHIFKPRAVGEGMGRTWYAPWSSGSCYALPIQAALAAENLDVPRPEAKVTTLAGSKAAEISYEGKKILSDRPARCTIIYTALEDRMLALVLIAEVGADASAAKDLETIRESLKISAPAAPEKAAPTATADK